MLFRRRTRRSIIAFLFIVSLFVATASATEASKTEASETGIQSFVLDNGLTVLMQPEHSTPVVGINIAYGVGTADETENEVGIAHLLEHMMFKGTKERPVRFGRLFRALGSSSNASTQEDRTVYHHEITADSNKLSAVLTLEADRMLNTQITTEDLATEKKVVAAERKNYDNDSYDLLHDVLLRAAYPNRPYSHPVLGTEASIDSVTKTQLEAFYKKYYTPNNATVVVVGDFDTDSTLHAVKAAFGSLRNTRTATPRPTGPVKPADAIPMAAQTEPLVLQRPGAPSRLQVYFPLPNFTHPDFPAITVLHFLLKHEEEYRLDTALVDTQQVASEVNTIQEYRREPGWYTIQVEGNPEQQLEDTYAALKQTLRQLVKQLEQPIDPAVLARVIETYKDAIAEENQAVDNRGQVLAEVQLMAGVPDAITRHIVAMESVTSEDVLRVARQYLDPDKAVVGFLEPAPNTSEASPLQTNAEPIERFVLSSLENRSAPDALLDREDVESVTKYLPLSADNSITDSSITDSSITDSSIADSSIVDSSIESEQSDVANQTLPEKVVLENGLQALLLPDDDAQAITLRGWVDAGDRFDPEGKAGTALLTARSLTHDAESEAAIALFATTDIDGVNLSAEIETEKLAAGIETIANYLQSSDFSSDRIKRTQQQLSDRLARLLTDIPSVNTLALQQAIYPKGHPAHLVTTPDSISAISPNDLPIFYSQHYRPENIILVFVGNFDPAQVKSQLAQHFGRWQGQGKAPTLTLPSVAMPENSFHLKREIPAALDSIAGAYTSMGHRTISRRDPRYYALKVANEIIGGGVLSSRLGGSLRDQQGLVYSTVGSRFNARKDQGEFNLFLNTPTAEDADQAIASAIAVLQQVKTEGITASELQAAKQRLIGVYFRALASPDTLADFALQMAINQLDKDELQTYPEKIRALTLEETQAAISDLIAPDKLMVVTTTSRE